MWVDVQQNPQPRRDRLFPETICRVAVGDSAARRPTLGSILGERWCRDFGPTAREHATEAAGGDRTQPGADRKAAWRGPLDPEPPRGRRSEHDTPDAIELE